MTTQSMQVEIELGHRADFRQQAPVGGFTHDWVAFVQGCEGADLSHIVDRVVFHLHDSFVKPKRVVREPPYQVAESAYAGFMLPIEIWFHSQEEPQSEEEPHSQEPQSEEESQSEEEPHSQGEPQSQEQPHSQEQPQSQKEPRRIAFNYDLFLNADGDPPVNHIRCEKLTFQNPSEDFRLKLIRAGGVEIEPTES